MITIRDPSDYGLTAADVLDMPGEDTKEGLFGRALSALQLKIMREVAKQLRDAKVLYEMCFGPRECAADKDRWDFELLQALGEIAPEIWQSHLTVEEPFDVDMAALRISGWATNGVYHDWSSKKGAFLSKLGVTAQHYESKVEEDQAETDQRILSVVGATRDEVSQAWRQFTHATHLDQGELAKSLAISRSTISNYGAGKTVAKCSVEQARVMAWECRERSTLLLAAAEVFERVK